MKKIKALLLVFAVLLLPINVFASVSGIQLAKTSVTVSAGKSITVKATTTPKGQQDTLVWESDQPDVATVDAGKIIGVAGGSAVIRVYAPENGPEKEIKVQVLEKTTKLAVSSKFEPAIGDKFALEIERIPQTANDKLTYKSSNTKIVKIDAKGKCTAIKAGTAKITIKAGKASAVCIVVVSAKSAVREIPADADVLRMFEAVNAQRVGAGLKELSYSKELSEYALIRAKEASTNWDLGHTRPDGRAWNTVIVNRNSKGAGENLAFGSENAIGVMVDGWMNSPLHRKNILTKSFAMTGLACYRGADGYYWCQIFME